MKKVALYPGSFDPITKGHIDIIKRSSNLFDKLIIGIFKNSTKSKSWFSDEEKVEMIEEILKKENIRAKDSDSKEVAEIDDNKADFLKLLHDALIALIISKSKKNSGTGGSLKEINNTDINSSSVNSTTITAITTDEIVKIITDCGSSERAAVEVTALLNEIESARYGKMENISNYKNTLFEKVTKLFQSLCVMLIAICTFYSVLAYPLKVSAKDSQNLQAGVIFLEAIKDYHNGNFQDAAKKFSSIVQAESDINDNIQTDNYYNKSVSSKKYQGIKNPYLYYNIGNAYIKAGDIGRAILWYERAKKEIPLDPDLRFNLEYAREFITDRLEISDDSSGIGISTGIDVSDLLFFWTDHFPPQMVNYSAIGLSFIFFTYAAIEQSADVKFLLQQELLFLQHLSLQALHLFIPIIAND